MLHEKLDAEWGKAWLEPAPIPADLDARVKKSFGRIPSWAPMLARVPWVVEAFIDSTDKKIAHMPIDLWDLIAFVVSQDNACRYCYGATRTVLKILGYSDAMIDRLESDVELDSLGAGKREAIHFARELTRANPLPGRAALDELRKAGFQDAAIAEITFAAAFSGFGNRVATMFAAPTDHMESMLKNPFMRLLRPFIARQMRGRLQPPAELPAPNEPPFDALIEQLHGSPVAHAARRTVDAALRSGVLPRRAKFLVFAVVGKAAGSDYVTRQSRVQLAGAGMLPVEIDEAIDHLSSSGLSPAENAVLPFARETVRYRTSALQQQTRALSAHLSAEELVETAGIAALANCMARLSVLLAA
jgi:alkylhydroperoxidase family enzyme